MANRVKGIIVEIGGNTGPLEKALKNVNSTIAKTQSQLKDIQKLLKLDPTNTELLSQKQDALGRAISATKDKLATLKDANEAATRSSENYDAWKKKYDPIKEQIDKTTEKINKLKEEQQSCEKAIAEGVAAKKHYQDLQDEIDRCKRYVAEYKQEQQDLESAIAAGDPEAKKRHEELQNRIDELTAHYTGLEKQVKTTEEVINKGELAKQKYDSLQDEIDDTKTKLQDLQNKAKAVSDEFGNPIPPDQVQAIRREIEDTKQALADMVTEAHNSREAIIALGDAGEALTKVGDAAENVGRKLTTTITAPIIGVGTAAVKTAADFEAGMSRVASVSDLTQDEFDQVSEKARQMGRDTVFSATEATDAFYYMGIAGWNAQEQMAGIEGVMNAAAAGGVDLARTSDIITDALTAFGESADQSNRFANVLTATMKNSNTDIDKLGESFKYASTTAGSLGFSVEDTAIALGLMANSSIKSGQAGNQLKNAMVNLIKPTKAQAEAMVNLGYISQETFKEIDFSKVEAAEAAVKKAQNGVENAQMSLNAAIEKYGSNSTQAAKAANALENAQITLQSANTKLETAQNGVSKSIRKNNDLMTNSDGSMKSLKEIMDVLRVTLNKTGVELTDAEGNTRDFDEIVKELTQSEEGLAQAKQLEAVATIFGKRNMAGMLAIVNASDEKYEQLAKSIYNSCWEVDKLSEELQNSNISWEKYNKKSWAAGKDTETICAEMGSDIAQMIQSTGTSAKDLNKVIQEVSKKYGITVSDAKKAVKATKDGMEKSAGEAEKTAGKMIDNLKGQLTLLKDAAADLGIEVGNILMPKIKEIVSKIRQFVEWLSNLDESQKKLIIRIAGIAAAIGPVLLVFGKITKTVGGAFKGIKKLWDGIGIIQGQLASGTGTIGKLFGSLGGSIGQVIGKIMPVAAVIGVLIAAFKHLWDTNEKFRERILTSWEHIKSNLSGTIDILKDAFGRLAEALQPVIEGAKQVWDKFCNALAPAFTFVVSTISNFTLLIKKTVGNIVTFFEKLFSGDIGGALDALGKLFSDAFGFIKTTIRNFLYEAKKIATSGIEWVKGNVSKLLENAPERVKQIVDKIGEFIGGVTKFISDVVEDIRTLMKFDNLQEALEYLWTCISVRANDAWVDICTWAKGIWPQIQEWFSSIWQAIQDNPILKTITDVLSAPFKAAWAVIEPIWSVVSAFFDDVFTLITGGSALAETEDGLSGPFTRSGAAIKALWDKAVAFFEGIWNDISQNPVLATVGNCISDIFTGAWTAIETVWNTVTQFFSDIWNAINSDDVLAGLGDAISGLFTGAWDTIKAVWETVTSFFADIWTGLMQNETFVSITDTISGAFTSAWDTIKSIWDTVVGFFEGIWTAIHDNEILGTIADVVAAPFQAAWTAIDTIWTAVTDYFTKIWEAITGDASLANVVSLIIQPFTDAWEGIKGIFTGEVDVAAWFTDNVWNKITGVFEGAGEWFKGVAESMWNGITGFFDGLGETITNFFTEKLIAPIKNAFNGIGDWVRDTAGNIWDGFTGGISNGVHAATGAVTGFFGNVWGGVTDFFGIHSPSKKAAEAGKYLMEGFSGGAADNKDATKKSLTAVFAEVKTSMDAAVNSMGASTKALEQHVTSLAVAVASALGNAEKEVLSFISKASDVTKVGLNTIVAIFEEGWKVASNITGRQLEEIGQALLRAFTRIAEITNRSLQQILNFLEDFDKRSVQEIDVTLQAIQEVVSMRLLAIGNAINSNLSSFDTGVQSLMESMTKNITSSMNTAVSTVQSAMRAIKDSTNFSWNLPHLQLPHISISGSWGFNPPSVPSFSVQWYKSAMEKGMILNNPTIFGMMNGKLLGAGEAGSETVVGTKSLLTMIRDAVSGMVKTQNVNYGGVTINVYGKEGQNVHELADVIERRINLNIMRKQAGHA